MKRNTVTLFALFIMAILATQYMFLHHMQQQKVQMVPRARVNTQNEQFSDTNIVDPIWFSEESGNNQNTTQQFPKNVQVYNMDTSPTAQQQPEESHDSNSEPSTPQKANFQPRSFTFKKEHTHRH